MSLCDFFESRLGKVGPFLNRSVALWSTVFVMALGLAFLVLYGISDFGSYFIPFLSGGMIIGGIIVWTGHGLIKSLRVARQSSGGSESTADFTSYTYPAIVLLAGTIILGFVTYAYYGEIVGFNDARIGVGLAGAVATIALALGIYHQGIQNNTIIGQNRDEIDTAREQSLILQESQWMPIGVFHPNGLRFEFTRNRPHNPRTLLEVNGDSTGWIEREVNEVNQQTDSWVVKISGEIYEERLDIDKKSYDGILRLRFRSTTGELYEYEYEVSIDTGADNSERITVHEEERKVPWNDEIT